jgi:hypothetical protein
VNAIAATEQADMARLNWNRTHRNELSREAAKDLREMERLQHEAKLAAVPMLSTDEIKRRLAAIKASDQLARLRGDIISMRSVANRAQLSLAFLYLIANGQRVPYPPAQRKLSAALQGVEMLSKN